MRRANHLFEGIVDRENLRLAVHKALRGKRSQTDAREFAANLDAELDRLGEDLRSGEIRLGDSRQFTIHDPKERLITAPSFRERVLHHAVMNVCEPIFERRLIADTFACRRGKGRLAALERAREFSREHAFFLKIDVRKYFDSVSHARLITLLERLFKERRLLALLGRIIAARETTPGRGLPIGSLMSQHFANVYLDGFDRFVKEVLRVRGFVRYMDDCALWSESTSRLRNHLASAEDYLKSELSLAFKPSPYINRSRHGLDFLGCRVFPDRLTLNRRSRVRYRRKLAALESAYREGAIDEATLQRRATALTSFTRTRGLSSRRFRLGVLYSHSVDDRRPTTG